MNGNTCLAVMVAAIAFAFMGGSIASSYAEAVTSEVDAKVAIAKEQEATKRAELVSCRK